MWLILHLHAKVNNIWKPKREQLTVKSIDAHVGIMYEDIWWLVFLDVLLSMQGCSKKRRKGKKLVSQLGSGGGWLGWVALPAELEETLADCTGSDSECCQNCLFWKPEPDKYNQLKDFGWPVRSAHCVCRPRRRRPSKGDKAWIRHTETKDDHDFQSLKSKDLRLQLTKIVQKLFYLFGPAWCYPSNTDNQRRFGFRKFIHSYQSLWSLS